MPRKKAYPKEIYEPDWDEQYATVNMEFMASSLGQLKAELRIALKELESINAPDNAMVEVGEWSNDYGERLNGLYAGISWLNKIPKSPEKIAELEREFDIQHAAELQRKREQREANKAKQEELLREAIAKNPKMVKELLGEQDGS